MIEEDAIIKLKKHFSNVHPLLFLRSTERSKTLLELFDILSDISNNEFLDLPKRWDDNKRKFVSCPLFIPVNTVDFSR